MALRKRGKHRYGDGQADICEELVRYATLNGYPAHHFADAVCPCGGRSFRLALDDAAGAAVRTCVACAVEHPIGDRRCPACGLTAVYGDWKNEFNGWRELLSRV